MATSGSYTFTYDFGELITEAAERAGLDPASLESRHLSSMRRSLNLILIDIDNYVTDAEFRLDRVETPLQDGRRAVLLPSGTIDVIDVQVRGANGLYWDLSRTTREHYMRLENQPNDGNSAPSLYWVTRELPAEASFLDVSDATLESGIAAFDTFTGQAGVASTTATSSDYYMVLWPTIATDAYTLVYYRMRQSQTVTALGDDLDTNRVWLDAITGSLAARTAQKFNPERYQVLAAEAVQLTELAKDNSYPKGDVVIGWRAMGRSRRRRI